MRNIKRLTCLVVAFLLIMTTGTVFAAFSDVPETSPYSNAVSALNQLGVITGYEDGTFKPDNDVTRAEFTAMLMRTLGAGSVGSTSSADLPFTDISDQDSDISWAIPNINTAYKNGIINGYPEDNTFRPNNNVLFEEAVKMIVCALGYGTGVNASVEPWYTEYMAQARSIGILKSAQNLGAIGSNASRACIAQMLYDSLEVQLVEGGVLTTKTCLSDYLGYVKNTGYIAANDLTSLDSPDVSMHQNEIQIRARENNAAGFQVHTYAVEDASVFEGKLGYQIEFFYSKATANEPVRKLFSYEIKENNSTVELTSSMIDSYESTNLAIRYYTADSGRSVAANLASDNIVIYNGKLYGNNADSSRFTVDMLPGVGTVTLLDSDNNSSYDIVTIWDYSVYYVASKLSSDRSITDNITREGSVASLILDVDKSNKLDIVRKSGEKIDFGAIAVGDVVCYASSNPGNGGEPYSKAVVVSDKASGTIRSVVAGEDMELSNGQTYNFSNAAPWMDTAAALGNTKTLEMPKSGETGTYALDINGDVFAYNQNSAEVSANTLYGYVIAYDMGNDLYGSIDTFRLRVLTQNNTKVDYNIRKGTRVNGVSVQTADDFINELYVGASYQKTGTDGITNIQQVIKYTTSGNYITNVVTVTGDTVANGRVDNLSTDKLYKYGGLDPLRNPVDLTYSNNKLSGSGVDLSVQNSIVFVVPTDQNRRKAENFSKRDSGVFSTGRTYKEIEAFDVSGANSARVIVMYGGASTTEVDESSPVMVITEIPGSNGYTSDVTGYQITRNSSKKIDHQTVSEGSSSLVNGMSIGDIYRTGQDSYGYMSFRSSDCLYPANDGYIDTGSETLSRWERADYCTIYGSVYYSNSTDGLVIVPQIGGDLDSAQQYTITTSSFNNSTTILRYDKTGRYTEVKDASEDGAGNLDGLASYSIDGHAAEVVLYMCQGVVKLMAIVNE